MFFLLFFCGMNCVFFCAFLSGMNCVFFCAQENQHFFGKNETQAA